MKKVLFFIESLAGGGAEKVLSDLVRNMDRTKFDITVCTVTDEDIYQNEIQRVCQYRSFLHKRNYRAGGIRKLFFWLGTKLIYSLPAPLVYRLCFREQFDVEVAFVEGFATKLIAASSNKNSKKLAWVHTDLSINDYADTCFRNIDAHKRAYQSFDKILCVSESVRAAFAQKYFKSERLCVQYNPVDEQAIKAKAQEPIDFEVTKHPVLGSIGRLENQKGYMRLLECVKRLRDAGYQFEVWIIGDGSMRKQLETKINEYHLETVFKLLGFHRNPYQYISKIDAFICSSYTEGFSTAATESLILGKPIFTVECAGMRELFGGLKCGEIVPNTEEDLYQMLKAILDKKYQLGDYTDGINERRKAFSIAARVKEIEGLME